MSGGLRVMMIGPYPEGDTPVGGVEAACRGLVTGMSRSDRVSAVHVLDFRSGIELESAEDPLPNVVIHRLPAQQKMRLLNGASADARRARTLFGEIAPDIVHGQGVGITGKLAVDLPCPSVVTVHGMAVTEAKALAQGLSGRLRVKALESVVRHVLERASGVISISQYDQEALSKYPIASKNVVIPNAVETRPSPDVDREKTVLYAGVVTPRKNVIGVLEAMSIVRRVVPGARLRIAGAETDSEYARRVHDSVARLGLAEAVELLGSLDSSRIAAEISRASALVLFSHQETLPVIVAEAMLGSCPVVASDVGGLREMIVDGETGILVQDRDIEGLARALVDILQDADLRRRMGTRAREVAHDRYDPDRVAAATLGFYERVLEARR